MICRTDRNEEGGEELPRACFVIHADGRSHYALLEYGASPYEVDLVAVGENLRSLAERIDLVYWRPGFEKPYERLRVLLDIEEQILWDRQTGDSLLVQRIPPEQHRGLLTEVHEARSRREAANRELDVMMADGLLSLRALNCLHDARIYSATELAEQTSSWLLGIKGFGHACLKEVEQALAKYGMKLREQEY